MKITEDEFLKGVGFYFKEHISQEVSARVKKILNEKLEEITREIVKEYIKAASMQSYEDVQNRQVRIDVNIRASK